MLIDEIREKLKSIEPDIQTIQNFWKNSKTEERIKELEQISQKEDFWQDKNQAEILKELQKLKNLNESYSSITKNFDESFELLDLFSTDEAELKKIDTEVNKLQKNVSKFKINILLDQPEDSANCFLTINAGAGGTESQDWANMLLRMYLRFSEREGFSTAIMDYQPGEEAGIKSATLFIKGKNAYGFLKNEHGIHRLVRISPFDANKRRHTSFAGVYVTPETVETEVKIDPKDLRIDTYRAGGAGGQHVNKTDSAVRITHVPTGIVVQCQNERSQTQNKETAMKMLMAKLAQKQKEEDEAKFSKLDKKKIEWGSQIRSYVLHPYKMVKDHRTEFESPQPDLVLDGDIMEFIEANLIKQ
ncbi:peptide chain release factor 2 [candidate division TM6 bacterium RIFCSPHIGHO2_12_FULL_32_22]|nr:MAG: peptide chain release factor 2 [candidate division TM6 bacterium RIFCSPHIGHO2_12_FULL_32_22]